MERHREGGYAINGRSLQEGTVIEFRGRNEGQLRGRIRETIQLGLEEELEQTLGCERNVRSGQRKGYCNGHKGRRVTTSSWVQELEFPRGRILEEQGGTRVRPDYARHTQEVDEAILSSPPTARRPGASTGACWPSGPSWLPQRPADSRRRA